MDPRLLLNPKAFAREQAKEKAKATKRTPNYGPKQSRKPQPSATNGTSIKTSPSTPRFDPKLLLNPRAAKSSARAHKMDDDNIDAMDTSGTDATNTPERAPGWDILFGQRTQARDAPLEMQKRKAETQDDDIDSDRSKSRTHFSGVGNAGLGTYLAEERKRMAEKQARDSNGPGINPIEVADDDDDDLEITSSKRLCKLKGCSNEVTDEKATVCESCTERRLDYNFEVCMGVLHCQANRTRIPAFAESSTLGKDFWPPTRCKYEREGGARDSIIHLVDRTGARFARITAQAAAALCSLLEPAAQNLNRFRIKIFIGRTPRKADEVPKMSVSDVINVQIIMYCPRNKADSMGRFLSQRNLFLSNPMTGVDSGVEVYNPHVPSDVRSKSIGGVSKPRVSASTTAIIRTAEEMRQDANALFENMQKNDDLAEKDADKSIIATELMPHQKQALHFLTAHEGYDATQGSERVQADEEPANEEIKRTMSKDVHTLWKERIEPNGRVSYFNVITGQRTADKPKPVYGGILADMMGLGKTLSILSLIAATVDAAEAFGNEDPPMNMGTVQRNAKTTVIVCPKSVLSNWSDQLQSHIHEDALSVYTYHGTGRIQDLDVLAQYDIILTTYGTVATEMADTLRKKAGLAPIQWFRVVLDEAHMIRNSNTSVAKGACAINAQRRWAVTGTPVQNKLDDLGALIRFLRIQPFDEPGAFAQYILAPFRTGNTDVLQHLRILVDSITLRRLKDKIDIVKKDEFLVELEMSEDERKLYERFAGQSNAHIRTMTNNNTQRFRGKAYAHVLKAILRMRMLCCHGKEMLNPEDLKDLEGMDEHNAIELGDEPEVEGEEATFITDRQAYEMFHMAQQSEMAQCADCGTNILNNRAEQRLEQDSDDAESSDDDPDEDGVMASLTPCYHFYCPNCREKLKRKVAPQLRTDGYHDCPSCEAYVRFQFFQLTRRGYSGYLRDHVNNRKKGKVVTWNEENYSGPHTKVNALLDALDKSRAESEQLPFGEPPIRSVVFTEWTSYLDLIEHALYNRDIGYVRLDGSLSVSKRAQVLRVFKTNPQVVVLLVSIRAGGQGLNFTAANKVYMMEPQFNPGVEQQAIDRVHRLGQERNVEITRFIMSKSIEQSIQDLQKKKVKLAQLSMEKKLSKKEESQKKIEELRDLFR
nr:hypothetical protein B0A51_07971 [Rachicladosporium sp. CCFEE 5018]